MPPEKEPFSNSPEYDPIPDAASDLELALFLSRHIDNPCSVEVEAGRVENIRQFYLREAEKILKKITASPEAARMLREKIVEYKKPPR